MTFKEKLIILRKIKGLTQDEFAKAVGVSRQAVYKWESGQSYPEVSKLLEIKLLFGISIDDLLDDNYEIALPEKKKRKRAVKIEEKPEEVKEEKAEQAEPSPVPEEKDVPVTVLAESADGEKKEETKAQATVEKSEEIPATEEDDAKKKVGFFGRLFGRK
jgi:transcriptional regulator with XRE-family HTH domain